MSEEIIIDGVNVAGCCCYENDKCLWTKRYYENNIVPDCEKVKNCYYKQLKRLQAENELLKDANAHLKTELKQRYDEPDFKSFRLMGKTIDEWKQLGAENEENLHYLACMTEQRNKLKLALEEIREIIRFPLYTNSTKHLSQIDFLINLVNEFEKNREKIITKINEVLK